MVVHEQAASSAVALDPNGSAGRQLPIQMWSQPRYFSSAAPRPYLVMIDSSEVEYGLATFVGLSVPARSARMRRYEDRG